MSDLPSLLLDIGNSSVKYCLLDNSQINFDCFLIERSSISELSKINFQVSSIYFSSVLDDNSNATIFELGDILKVPVYQCKSKTNQFDISNAYNNPSNMGDDRWMAIIAGVTLCNKGDKSNVLVVDSGSAITCDFVINGNHQGGWIAPGIKMSRKAVVANTKRVFDAEQNLDMLTLGRDTPDCVSNGALAQVSGMVRQAIFLMQQKSSQGFDIYLSGGDAKNIMHVINQTTLKNNDYSVHFVENLVLVGLARIAKEKSI